jgi:hypothetical protein
MKKLSRRARELGLKFYEIAIQSYAENDGWTAPPSERSEKLKVPKSLRSDYFALVDELRRLLPDSTDALFGVGDPKNEYDCIQIAHGLRRVSFEASRLKTSPFDS